MQALHRMKQRCQKRVGVEKRSEMAKLTVKSVP
jgi:hypothetical protein